MCSVVLGQQQLSVVLGQQQLAPFQVRREAMCGTWQPGRCCLILNCMCWNAGSNANANDQLQRV